MYLERQSHIFFDITLVGQQLFEAKDHLLRDKLPD